VEPGGPAAKSGLQAGDVVVGFDGKPIASSGDLPSIVAAAKPGETVSVRVMRQGAERELKLTVGEIPSERVSVAGGPALQQGKLGVTVRPGDDGLVVEQAEGPAAKAGLRPGDVIVGVNGTPVRSADELKSAVDASSSPSVRCRAHRK
jgi:serine protease Do